MRTATRLIVYPLLALALAWSLWDYLEARRVDRAIAAIQASRDRVPAALPGARGGAPAGDPQGADPEGRQAPPHEGPDAGRMYAAAAMLVAASPERRSEVTRSVGRWSPAQRDEAVRLVAANEPAFTLLREARRLAVDPVWLRNRGVRDLLGDLRQLQSVNLVRVRLLCDAGRGDDAVEAMLDEIGALRMYEHDSFGLLVRMGSEQQAIDRVADALGTTRVSAERLAALQATFERQPLDNWPERIVLADRAVVLRTLERGPRGFVDLLIRPFRHHRAVAELESQADALRSTRGAWDARIAAGEQEMFRRSLRTPEQSIPRWTRSVGSVDRVSYLLAQTRIRRGAILMALNVERFRLAHGHPPKTFAELTAWQQSASGAAGPGNAAVAVSVDPIDGVPWVYQREDDGYVVHGAREGRSRAETEAARYRPQQHDATPQPTWGVRIVVTTLLAKPDAPRAAGPTSPR